MCSGHLTRSYLSRLPIICPELLALPEVGTIYNLPAVVRDCPGWTPAWPGAHNFILFGGRPIPAAEVEGVDPTYPHLNQWMSDVAFPAPEYLGNLMGYIVATLARPSLDLFPFLVLDSLAKKREESGCEAIHIFLTGRRMRPLTFTGP